MNISDNDYFYAPGYNCILTKVHMTPVCISQLESGCTIQICPNYYDWMKIFTKYAFNWFKDKCYWNGSIFYWNVNEWFFLTFHLWKKKIPLPRGQFLTIFLSSSEWMSTCDNAKRNSKNSTEIFDSFVERDCQEKIFSKAYRWTTFTFTGISFPSIKKIVCYD